MSTKVEIGFTEAGASAPFFILNDPVLGVLNGTKGVLGGEGAEVLVDVTEYLIGFSINRGKSRELDRHQAGQATVNFKNELRVFDPTFEASPFFGQIEPRRQIRITADDIIQFEGTIDDWNIAYNAGGNSVSTAVAFDGFANLANITLEDFEPDQELCGARITAALDNIEWPQAKRDIAEGNATLEAQTVEAGTGILDYLQTVANSEPGEVFIDKSGRVKFTERNSGFSSARPIFTDGGSGIGYKNIAVQFGVELLFNEITVTNSSLRVTEVNGSSVNLYGKRDLERQTFLSDEEQLEKLATFLTGKFADPEFRFEQIEIDIKTLSANDRDLVLELEIGDVVQVNFTPSNIPPAIERLGRVISLAETFTPSEEIITFGLQAIQSPLLVLNDPVFGKLSRDNALGY